MDNVLKLALAKGFKAPKELPSPGEYNVDTTIRIVGSVKVGESYTQRCPAEIPWQDIAAIALSKLNTATMESIVREAIAGEFDSKAIKANVADYVQTIVDGTEKEYKGKVTTKLVAMVATNQKFLQA